jgi:hypothetical protein
MKQTDRVWHWNSQKTGLVVLFVMCGKLKKRQIAQTPFSKYYYQIYCCEDSNLETELCKQLCVQNDDAKDYVLYLPLYNEWVILLVSNSLYTIAFSLIRNSFEITFLKLWIILRCSI